ncbi:MAG: helix-turn-helix transcriptional regulator [Deltaproteobacteria bacterium]|nr:helix-turn-helix transcriptional regulator [Deltaproteobacteria bacterium]
MTPAQGEKIYQLRTKLGLTPQQFGRMAGVTAVVVAKWESGFAEPGWLALGRIRRACDVDLNWLLDSGDDRPDYLQNAAICEGKLVDSSLPKISRNLEQKLIGDYRKLNEIDRSFVRMVLETVGKTPEVPVARRSSPKLRPNPSDKFV